MEERKPTWAVVATVHEPPALVQAFVAWHLQQGASEVFIYCDDPLDPVASSFAHLYQVSVDPCDAAHWSRLHKARPPRHEVRQVYNARDAFERSHADWLLHIDADEFVWSAQPVEDHLTEVDVEADACIIPVAERIHLGGISETSIFDGGFRRPFRDAPAKGLRLFGPEFALTYRGLTGHAQGKAFVRRGRPLKMSIHRPRKKRGEPDPVFARAEPDHLELLHFEGLTPIHWTQKLAKMARAFVMDDGMPLPNHRRSQAEVLLADPEGAEALYARLKCPKERVRAALDRHGLAVSPAFDLTAALQTYFPDTQVDVSPQSFDAWLRRERAEVFAFLADHVSSE